MATFQAGITRFTINGTSWRPKTGTVNGSVLEKKLETIMGPTAVAGVKVTAQAPYLELDVTMADNFSAKSLEGLTGALVTVETRMGAVYMLTNASYVADGAQNFEEGSIKLRFEGETGREVL
jgi:hypothetical protein